MLKTAQSRRSRVFVFIDAENVRNSMESYGYKDLNYSKIYIWLKTKMGAKHVYIYAGIEQGDLAKEKKFKDLQKLGYFVSAKKVMLYIQTPLVLNIICDNCNKTITKTINRQSKPKANCDTELTLDIINCGIRKKYDEIVVFSGDGDFARVYEYVVKQLKKKVTVYSPKAYPHSVRTSSRIKELSKNGTIILEDLSSLLQHYGEK